MYDDGFVAYLNGQFIASKNAPYPAKWNSLATDSHADAAATSYELFDIHQHKDKLIEGENLLALQGLNLNIVSTDMLIAGVLSTSRGERQIQIWDHVDEDSFYPFWALEGLMASWDGYAGNANNFFIYLHPESKKFHFMPWGTDSLFLLGRSSRRSPATLPTVLKNSVLVDYLWRFPEVREKYAKAVLKILKETWHEDQLIAEINRLEPMLRRSINPQQFDYTRQLQLMRQFIQGRRQQALTDMSLYLQKPSTTKP